MTKELVLFMLLFVIILLMINGLDDFSVGVEVLPDCFCLTAVVLNSAVWGIGFTFNNTTQLIVPNKIICLLDKTLPGILATQATKKKQKTN